MLGGYDPNLETTNTERVIAAHWELLRRNNTFSVLSRRWLKSERFRRSHALSPAYHDLEHHTPRCAWDWMLSAQQRCQLAEFQIKHLSWFLRSDFNFGPIICEASFSPAAVTSKNWQDFLRVRPLVDPPPPITVEVSWASTPDLFKKQFRVAYGSTHEFSEVNGRLQEHGKALACIAAKLAHGDRLREAPVIADYLFTLGHELREWSEFYKVFKIPKRPCSEQQFRSSLDQIQRSFRAAKLLFPTKAYDLHQSYQGTPEDWRWFLESERRGLDVRKSADASKLAALYSDDLRQRAMRNKAPRQAKAHGFSGSILPSRVVKNRRSTVRRHVRTIQAWIDAAFPKRPRKCQQF